MNLYSMEISTVIIREQWEEHTLHRDVMNLLHIWEEDDMFKWGLENILQNFVNDL